jgi:peptidyl-prolyl cis-trans isomerase SurA
MKLARQRVVEPLYSSGIALLAMLALVCCGSSVLSQRAHAEQPAWTSTVQGAAPSTKKSKGSKAAPTTTAKATPADEKQNSGNSQSIVALVNDDPITGYEIEQRIKLALMGTPELQKKLQERLKSPKINDQFKAFAIKKLQANPPKSQDEQQARVKQLQAQFVASMREEVVRDFRPVARKNALDELIDERLKLQEAKRNDVVATKEDVDRALKGMAERNKMTLDEFSQYVTKMGVDFNAMRERIKASLSWADVIRRRFGHQITVATRDVDRLVATIAGQDDVNLRVSRILLAAPADQKGVARRLSDAEHLRVGFHGCATMAALASGAQGARYDDLGERKPTTIPEPTRSLLLNARDDEMLPPTIGEGGVELWAVCGRKTVKADDAKRETAENDLRQKEFEILSKKALKDLHQDAHIEMR